MDIDDDTDFALTAFVAWFKANGGYIDLETLRFETFPTSEGGRGLAAVRDIQARYSTNVSMRTHRNHAISPIGRTYSFLRTASPDFIYGDVSVAINFRRRDLEKTVTWQGMGRPDTLHDVGTGERKVFKMV
jgi:hypothetical protein